MGCVLVYDKELILCLRKPVGIKKLTDDANVPVPCLFNKARAVAVFLAKYLVERLLAGIFVKPWLTLSRLLRPLLRSRQPNRPLRFLIRQNFRPNDLPRCLILWSRQPNRLLRFLIRRNFRLDGLPRLVLW